MRHSILIVLTVLCGLLGSCMKWGNRENRHLIQQAQLFIEQMPDSALTLLDAMNVFDFSNAERSEYHLLRIQAKSNAGMDISSETEIFDAREHFIKGKDPQKAAEACYYAALVAAGDVKQAMEYQQEALDFARKADNKLLQGRILYTMGYLNYHSDWYDDALVRYRQALKIFQSFDQYKRVVNTLGSISNSLLLKNQTDSAQYYYRQALDLAYKHEDTELTVSIYTNLGALYGEQGQNDSAIHYIKQAMQLATKDDEKMYIFLNLAYIFHETGNADSARHYVKLTDTLLEKIDNIYTAASLANLAYLIEKTGGNCQKALEQFELSYNLHIEIMEDSDRKLLLEMQRKYDITSRENELNRQRNRVLMYAAVSLVFLLALAVFSIYILRGYMKQRVILAKEKQANAENKLAIAKAEREKMEKSMELEQAMQQAQTLQEMYSRRDNEIKTKFLERIGIIKKIALLSPYINEVTLKDTAKDIKLIQKTRDIVKDIDLQNFTDIANELYPGFTCRLKQAYSELDGREISICCLLLFDFSNQEIDLFINRRMSNSLHTVQTWKTNIRRKLNIESYGDIKSCLLEKFTR